MNRHVATSHRTVSRSTRATLYFRNSVVNLVLASDWMRSLRFTKHAYVVPMSSLGLRVILSTTPSAQQRCSTTYDRTPTHQNGVHVEFAKWIGRAEAVIIRYFYSPHPPFAPFQ